jgi:hypothetical protein
MSLGVALIVTLAIAWVCLRLATANSRAPEEYIPLILGAPFLLVWFVVWKLWSVRDGFD